MKQYLALTLALTPNLGWSDTFVTPFPVSAVTVFPQGALVSQNIEIDLPTGKHTVALPMNLVSGINQVPVFDVSGAALHDVNLQSGLVDIQDKFLTPEQMTAKDEFSASEKELNNLRRRQGILSDTLDAISKQRGFLSNIQPQAETPRSVEDIVAITAQLPQAFSNLATAKADTLAQLEELNIAIKKAEDALNLRRQKLENLGLPGEGWGSVLLTVDVPAAQTVAISALGFEQNAGWSMEYDVRLNADETQIKFDRRAIVNNFTDTAWSNVALTLSSAKPFFPVDPSIPWKNVVRYEEEIRQQAFSKASGRALDQMSAPMMEAEVVTEVVEAATAGTFGQFDGVAMTFQTPEKVNVPGGEGVKVVYLNSLSQDVAVDRYANPRREKTAFVRAKFTNDTGAHLLSGNGFIYRAGNLIGNTAVKFAPSGAEVTMFFGPDQSIPLDFRFLSEFKGDEGIFTKSNTREEALEFDVENLGSTAQDITVAYALPITENEDVTVDLNVQPKPDAVDVDGVNGRSEWNITLAPGENQTFTLDAKITWPEGGQIFWRP